MKKGVIWIALTFLMVAALVLASCNPKTTTSTPTTTTTTAAIVTTTTTTTVIAPTSTTSTTAVTTAVTTTSTGHWWDSLGTPKYGGSLTMSTNANYVDWDPYLQNGSPGVYNNVMEQCSRTPTLLIQRYGTFQLTSFLPIMRMVSC